MDTSIADSICFSSKDIRELVYKREHCCWSTAMIKQQNPVQLPMYLALTPFSLIAAYNI